MSKLGDAYLAIVPQLDDSAMSSALGGVSSKLEGIGDKAKEAFAVVSAAAVAATAAVVGGAVEQYASYEQNIGGIQKLFGNMGQTLEEYAAANGQTTEEAAEKWQALEDAQDLVARNASNAFQSCGVSANDYMETVTSFSAALINSLGGDTQAAAEQAQVAMVAMSDNVNTFGTDMQDVQNAFQGFAKQNYTMLDNLKLGYGGTQDEMKRLISDANEYAASIGEASDLSIDSFSDIVTAIELIQEKQNIAGTTAREASTTIEGSVNQMRAAWENWLTVLGSGDYETVMTSTADLVESVKTALGNILPVVETVFRSIADALPEMMAELEPILSEIVDEWGEPLAQAAATALGAVFSALGEQMPGLLTVLGTLLNSLIDELILNPLSELGTSVCEGIASWWDGLVTGFGEWLGGLGTTVNDAGTRLGEGINSWCEERVAELGSFLASLATAVAQGWADFWSSLGQWVAELGTTVNDAGTRLRQSIDATIDNVVASLASFAASAAAKAYEAGSQFLSNVAGFFSQLPGTVWGWLSSAISRLEEFASTAWAKASEAGQQFLSGLRGGFESAVSFVASIPGQIVSALGNVSSLLWNAGASIIGGLRDGIVSAVQGVYSYVSGIADKIAALKGPLPYDRKVLIPNGEALMESLYAGIESGFGDVEGLVSGMADALSADMAPEVSGTVALARSATVAPAATSATPAARAVNVYVNDATVNGYDEIVSATGDYLRALYAVGAV